MSKNKSDVNKEQASAEAEKKVSESENTEQEMKSAKAKNESDADNIVKDEEALNAEKEKKESESEDESLNDKYMRLAADFRNFKKRAERERSDIYARANEKLATELLDVLDNFERALATFGDDENTGFKSGMEMIFNQIQSVLQNAGVKEITAEGVEFDPNYHNAVMMEDTDEVESGKISTVLQKGYTLNGRVIRHSMVKVAN